MNSHAVRDADFANIFPPYTTDYVIRQLFIVASRIARFCGAVKNRFHENRANTQADQGSTGQYTGGCGLPGPDNGQQPVPDRAGPPWLLTGYVGTHRPGAEHDSGGYLPAGGWGLRARFSPGSTGTSPHLAQAIDCATLRAAHGRAPGDRG